jgi:hypothetical protein
VKLIDLTKFSWGVAAIAQLKQKKEGGGQNCATMKHANFHSGCSMVAYEVLLLKNDEPNIF